MTYHGHRDWYEMAVAAGLQLPKGSLSSIGAGSTHVSFMDFSVVGGIPLQSGSLVFFDSLLWARGSWTWRLPALDPTVALIAQRFFDCRQSRRMGDRPVISVGAVLPFAAKAATPTATAPSDVVMALGGMRSPANTRQSVQSYVAWAARLLGRLDVPSQLVLPNMARGCIEKALPANVEVVPAEWRSLEHIVSPKALVLMPPGLETVLEMSALGVPFRLLPPFNGTQLAQGRAYSRMANESFLDLAALDRYPSLDRPKRFSEWTAIVQDTNTGLFADDVATERMIFAAQAALNDGAGLLRGANEWHQRVLELGTSGVTEVADYLTSRESTS